MSVIIQLQDLLGIYVIIGGISQKEHLKKKKIPRFLEEFLKRKPGECNRAPVVIGTSKYLISCDMLLVFVSGTISWMKKIAVCPQKGNIICN